MTERAEFGSVNDDRLEEQLLDRARSLETRKTPRIWLARPPPMRLQIRHELAFALPFGEAIAC
jgi:hypothetical protein